MPVYHFKATDAASESIAGVLTADTPAAARHQLRLQGLQIEAFHESCVRGRSLRSLVAASRKRRQDVVAEWARHLALLLRTGVPLAEAVDVLIAQSHGQGQTVLRYVRERLAAGSSLAEALASRPAWFDGLFINAVRVGQVSGSLDDALSELAGFLEERQALHSKLTGALVYPVILLILGVGVVLFLMTYVMPQLLGVLEASGRALPASTMFLKALSDGLIEYGWILGIAVVVSGVGLGALLRSDRGRRTWHRAQLRLPLAGSLVRKAVVAQFAQMLVLLLRSGVPFVEAIVVVQDSTRNRVLADELETVRTTVEAGSDIAPALEGSRIFPPLVVHLVAVGQEAGELPEMLEQLKKGYETEVRLAIGKFTTALEPLLIVILAAIIGFVIFATMMPILEATRVMG